MARMSLVDGSSSLVEDGWGEQEMLILNDALQQSLWRLKN